MFAILTTLKMRALALRSSVHNEHCLSAIELCAMNAKKTNEIIDVINELVTSLETGTFSATYDEETESLTFNFGGESNE